MRRATGCVLIICLLLIFASCSRGPQKDILGKWKSNQPGDEKIEFLKNGDLIIYEGDDKRGKVKYEFINDNKLKIISGDTEPEIVEVSITRKELKWDVNNTQKMTIYRKTR